MTNTRLLLPFLVLGLLGSGAVFADASRGKLLYENHCQGCHASTVHVRDQRKVTSPDALRAMIVRWSEELKLGWRDSERADVFHHLNNRYYRFAPEPAPKP